VSERSERIQRLVKEWLKNGNNGLPDELKDLLQNPIDSQMLKGGFEIVPVFKGSRFGVKKDSILERYKHRRISLHLHFFKADSDAGVVGMIEPEAEGHYCAVAEFLVSQDRSNDGFQRTVTGGVRPIQFRIPSDGGNQVQVPVLVNVMELGKQGQWMSLPSVVRLQTLDECHRLCGNVIQSAMFSHGFVESLGAFADREEMSVGGASKPNDRERNGD
jgi:hypothetical protein